VRFAPVRLSAPKGLKEGSIDLWVVHLIEPDPPAGIEPLKWLLLTNVPTTTDAEALERARWYSARWGIEVFHRTLKTGCRIKDRELGYRQSRFLDDHRRTPPHGALIPTRGSDGWA
jgi:hypothetical protein